MPIEAVTVEYVELVVKDQYLSRCDMIRLKETVADQCMHRGKKLFFLGIRAQVNPLPTTVVWAGGYSTHQSFLPLTLCPHLSSHSGALLSLLLFVFSQPHCFGPLRLTQPTSTLWFCSYLPMMVYLPFLTCLLCACVCVCAACYACVVEQRDVGV